MTIVCGTDFSPGASQAVQVAAALAKRLGEPLELVHAVDEAGAELGPGGAQSRTTEARARLKEEADAQRALLGIVVTELVQAGRADEVLVSAARVANARLLVLSPLGRSRPEGWLLGSSAERTTQSSTVPVLVVRTGDGLEAWARGERRLRVMVGADLSATSKAAIGWLPALRAMGACDVIVAHLAWPPAEHARIGLSGPMPLDALRPEVEEVLLREVREWVGDVAGEGDLTFEIKPALGRVDVHLTLLAEEAKVDLLLVGMHRRSGVDRVWNGSVSRGVLHLFHGNVCCVPTADAEAASKQSRDSALPRLRRVLCSTNGSPEANRALPFAYSLLGQGGIVHLLYVSEKEDPGALARIQALVPPAVAGRGIETRIEIVRHARVADAICQAAERLGVDAICMATHGRAGLSRLLLGSVAQDVMQRSPRPVYLVPPVREP